MAGKNTDIVLFDSGVGGLSLLDEVARQIPSAHITFVCDNQGFPYGTKTDEELIHRVEWVITKLLQTVTPKVIVLACNTASTIALEAIRRSTSIPVVGVVPAIKTAAHISQTKTIGLLATPRTIARTYTQQLINDFANHCQVIRIGSSELVHFAEDKLRGKPINADKIKTLLIPFAEPQLDTIVLGCTHFPHLREELCAHLAPHIRLIDSSEAVARQTLYVLGSAGRQQSKPQREAIFTLETSAAKELADFLKSQQFSHVSYWAESETEIAPPNQQQRGDSLPT